MYKMAESKYEQCPQNSQNAGAIYYDSTDDTEDAKKILSIDETPDPPKEEQKCGSVCALRCSNFFPVDQCKGRESQKN